MKDTSIGGELRPFPETSWSTILRGRVTDPVVRRKALEKLLALYWKPVYGCMRFGWNKSPEDAKDAVQDFFIDLLERDFVRDIEPEKGRFRSFLKAALKHYMLNEKRGAGRVKRGGRLKTFSLDGFEEITTKPGEPDSVFDSVWFKTLLESAIQELGETLNRAERPDYFRVLKLYDLSGRKLSYAAAAEELALTETNVRNYLYYARKLLRRILIRRISEYALDEEDVRGELRWILGSS